jgi:TRAP transporter 4TM/12TM fusion protein
MINLVTNFRLGLIIKVIGAAWVLYHILAGEFLLLGDIESNIIHINGAVLMTLLTKPIFKKFNQTKLLPKTLNFALIVGTLISGIYIYIMMPVMMAGAIGRDFPVAVVLGLFTIFVILDGNRRLEGWALPMIVLCCLLYARFGEIMPSLFAHADFDAKRITNLLYLGTDGIYGMIARVSFMYIGLFIIYAQFIRVSGAGDFFLEFANAVAGHVRGGPAKSAVVASSLFGTISGSAVANVAGTGCVTIPLMKRTGYPPHIAGAIEAAASTGGQIMPPVMGASAFLMAYFIGIPYFDVAVSALIPAVLYYLSLFCAVDLEAGKRGIRGLKKEELPRLTYVLKKGWHHCISPMALIYLMAIPKWTATRSAFWALMVLLVVCFLKREKRFFSEVIWKGLVTSVDGVAMMGTVSGALGVIVGIFGLTGLTLKLSSIIIDLAGGSVVLLLILTMITSIFFGMGLPTVAAYVLLVILVAPALQTLGIPLLVAHMFVFYFGIFSVITPPVALASMAASSIAESNFWKTGWAAVRIGVVGFILPYAFVYNPQLLLINPSLSMVIPLVTTTVGVYAMACGLTGFFLYPIRWFQRALLLVGTVLLIETQIWTDLVGLSCLAVVFIPQIIRRLKTGKA